ncbi:Gfo/Idh/MocA family protein [Leadbettera azotonutricia]|uniref:Gfo/Idh/MocA family protein n=1 Tax=Leadbettera azotonutricia TaxID=150829 RepID=UPI00030C355E|nr:Gfo/Idh/MocA family oxidoreductase [Leadbettera azotonutricia]
MLKAAVIGLGVIGKVHISAIESLENAKLVAACDIDPDRNVNLPHGVAFYTDYGEMLRREKPDVAHICLPHFLHYPAAKKFAEAGINVFTEKPLALNAAEGEEYCKLENQYGVKICLCFQNRLNSTTEALHKILQSGEYGKVTGIRGSVAWYRSKHYYEEGPWRGIMAQSGGGVMTNQAIHTLDLIQYFAGSPATRVKGSIGQVLDYGVEVEDTATGRISFANGATGFFTASIGNFADENVEINVFCEKGAFAIRDNKLFCIDGDKEEALASNSSDYAGKAVYGNSHVKLIDTFYKVLENGSGWYIHPEEGLPSLRIIDAIRESSRTGKTVNF